ncbi:MAG: bifunctional phosphoribosylaminoimidazolecarboxamide formyltransferase/IMP cyclohydrolase [Deltaproteobacteria bacterium]|nr:bifunctional phosphoribosylaminoimidazolecarboxamide formyltransferase/IMP cyclohydrolase [Deltaproteobacteria bacterium]
MARIARALVSVSDKTGLEGLARALAAAGAEILSTGGTAKALAGWGIAVTAVGDYTGQPEILDGRVKTLHPKIHGGILGIRGEASHREQMAHHGIGPIDLVVVNLYPFEQVIARPQTTLAEAIEHIDIGGPSMVRSAAKNHADVTVLTDPDDYEEVMAEIARAGEVSAATNRRLAQKAFALTARYDAAIADYLATAAGDEPFGPSARLVGVKVQDLRYGENPHQRAAFYRDAAPLAEPSVTSARQIHGKELSFNNLVDANAALELVKEFRVPAAVAIKHMNPCGVAVAAELVDAFSKARASDPVSIFGGIVAVNRVLDRATAEAMQDLFLEVVIAPRVAPAAMEVFRSSKKLANVRVLSLDMDEEVDLFDAAREAWRGAAGRSRDVKRVVGGFLAQDRDLAEVDVTKCEVVTTRAPSADDLAALDFAWRVCKHVKSNAIVVTSRDQVIGVGAGQMSRVDSARLAIMRAGQARLATANTVAASDAFFPFRDGLDVLAAAGVGAVIQPGGSVRDGEVIAAANEHGMTMILTGQRHFRH